MKRTNASEDARSCHDWRPHCELAGADGVRPLRILQAGTIETGGGAAAVAGNLLRGYRARGCEAWLAVGQKASDDPRVFVIPDDDRAPYRKVGYVSLQRRLRRLASRSPGRGWGRLSRSLRFATHPQAFVETSVGREDFEFPGTYGLLDLTPARPDIVHCHNLHGDYFDLRALPWLSRQLPTMLTMHDAWLLGGHCAHSFDCERWKAGCGQCPDLAIDPAIRRDATADNWARKRNIYARSRLYIATPCQWLLGKVEQSILAPAIAEARVIPNGVDLSVFHPADTRAARAALDLPQDAHVVLVTTGSRGGMWRDHQTLRAAAGLIRTRGFGRDLLVVVLGGDATVVRLDGNNVRAVGYEADPLTVARYYQAADLYVHAAREDTFPNTILEALACGTPVVATAVGGIPEQIRSTTLGVVRSGALQELKRATGMVVPIGDAHAMAAAAVALLANGDVRHLLARNAASDARARFDVNRQVECYLAWYRTIIGDSNGHAMPDPARDPARASGYTGVAPDRGRSTSSRDPV